MKKREADFIKLMYINHFQWPPHYFNSQIRPNVICGDHNVSGETNEFDVTVIHMPGTTCRLAGAVTVGQQSVVVSATERGANCCFLQTGHVRFLTHTANLEEFLEV